MADGSVLIVGQRPDPHIDTVAELLRNLGRTVILLDRGDPAQAVTIELDGRGNVRGRVHTVDGDLDFGEIASVWWRVKPVRPVDFGFGGGDVEEAFASREWMEVLRSLPELLREARWVNVPTCHTRVARKPRQLALAREVGLTCPETIITNRAISILDGFDRRTPLVYKTLSSFVRPPDEIVFTSEVTQELILQSESEIAMAPGIFQRKIPKRHEIRVTVVGEHVFSVGIDSQSDAATEVDWRRDQGRAMYFVAELSSGTQDKLLAFHQRAELAFATYDFIVTPENDEVFLECNPGGQWLWLEQALGLEISARVAGILAR